MIRVLTTRQIRDEAADLLESRDNSWTQGRFRDQNADGSYCYSITGACLEVVAPGVEDITNEEWRPAYAAAVEATPSRATPESWNDTPGRTREEVIAALRAR